MDNELILPALVFNQGKSFVKELEQRVFMYSELYNRNGEGKLKAKRIDSIGDELVKYINNLDVDIYPLLKKANIDAKDFFFLITGLLNEDELNDLQIIEKISLLLEIDISFIGSEPFLRIS